MQFIYENETQNSVLKMTMGQSDSFRHENDINESSELWTEKIQGAYGRFQSTHVDPQWLDLAITTNRQFPVYDENTVGYLRR
jgi:hypothetical protein